MTYKLPFGLKQKPLRHYFAGGSLGFSCREGVLYATLSITTRRTRREYDNDDKEFYHVLVDYKKSNEGTIQVTSKEQLDKLLKVKAINEIPALEIVA